MSVERLFAWIGSLSDPNPATNGLPTCPYAQYSLERGRVEFVFKHKFRGLADVDRVVSRWSDRFDVVLLIVSRRESTAVEASAIVDAENRRASAKDLVVMVDHPDRPFVVDGKSNSNGEYVIFFIQRKSRLEAASKALRPTGYYRNWIGE